MELVDISDLVTLKTAADRKGVFVQSIYKAIAAGRIACIEIDGVKFVHWRAIEGYQPRAYRERSGPSYGGRRAKGEKSGAAADA